MSVRAVDPHMFEIRQNADMQWEVITREQVMYRKRFVGVSILVSTCDTEREAQDVQAALVCAAAGRAS